MSVSGSRSPRAARRKLAHRVIIAHGENVRSFTIRPWMVGTVSALALTLSALYVGATGYLIFRDGIVASSVSGDTEVRKTYEDRIASLRSEIDRLTSRHLVNQQALQAEIERLVGRQAALDARQDVIAGLSQAVRRAGIAPRDIAPALTGADKTPEVPLPRLRTSSISASHAGAITFALSDRVPAAPIALAAAPIAEIRQVEQSLDQLAVQQVAYVDAVAGAVGDKADRISKVLKRLGHRVPAAGAPLEAGGIGGPFVEIDTDADPETFRSRVDLITSEIERFAAVRRAAMQLPLASPAPGSKITSRYGARMDPFLGKPAMHTGIDFRATTGDPVRATAGGKVITAEYAGGYGNMVEIDHGNGVTTRFAHLSAIGVKAGQSVAKGEIVGKAGNTGRSTGPHIHYEIRVDGSAIDPMRYVSAGREISSLL